MLTFMRMMVVCGAYTKSMLLREMGHYVFGVTHRLNGKKPREGDGDVA